MATEESRQRAAQAWCKPNTVKTVMNPELAEEFAQILDEVKEELEPDDEDYYDITKLEFEIGGLTVFRSGLKYLCDQQEYTHKPMYMALRDYDVVISVTKHNENEQLIVDNIVNAILMCKKTSK